jgi:hypothetical protein
MQRGLACANRSGFSIGRIAASVSAFADAHPAAHREDRGPRAQLMMGVVVVRVMMSVMVVVVMRRVRQRDVGEKNQCDREANNLTHDSISNP